MLSCWKDSQRAGRPFKSTRLSKFATGASGPLLLSGDGIVAMGALAAFVRRTF